MVISFNYRNLISATVLTGLVCTSSFVMASSTDKNHDLPLATTEEAKIKHWSDPEREHSFWDIAQLDKAYIEAAPKDRSDGIAVGRLGVDGGNKALIMQLAKEIADNKHAEVDSMLIAQNGKVLFESYYSRGRMDLSHPQSSTTKSYTALAIGRAIQLGYLSMADLDKPLVSFLNGLDSSKFVEGAENVTLNLAMSMSSGIQISSERMEEYRQNRDRFTGIKLVQALFEDSAPITDLSQQFNYQGFNPDLVMQVLDSVVPGSAEDFIKRELLNKLGIVNYDWRTDQSGLPMAGSFSSITSRDMLKFGTLVMNKGNWKGEQLLPEAFIQKATNSNITLTAEQVQNFYSGDKLSSPGYGYFWWPADMKLGNKDYLSVSAQGGGGMTILFIDELDLLVVITAHARQAYLQMIAERILPAFAQHP